MESNNGNKNKTNNIENNVDISCCFFGGKLMKKFNCLIFSTKPSGPWKNRGIIMGNKEQGGANTNLPDVIDFKGKCYFFCHSADFPVIGALQECLCRRI